MSRINKDHVWEEYFGHSLMELCMCCQNVLIYRYAFSDPFLPEPNKRNWHRGHIIPDRLTGPDIMENLNPICTKCNDKDKKEDSNYHYRVTLNLMTKEDADKGVARIRGHAQKHITNPEFYECIAYIRKKNEKKGEKKCSNKKLPHTPFCGIHKKKESSHLQKYASSFLSRRKAIIEDALATLDNSDEDYSQLLSMQKELADMESLFVS